MSTPGNGKYRLYGIFAAFIMVAVLDPTGIFTAKAQTRHKVGIIAPLTGPLAGIDAKDIQEGVEEAMGELPSDIRPELLFYDGPNPARVAQVAKMLIYKDKVSAIIGPQFQSLSSPLIGISGKDRIPVISLAVWPRSELGSLRESSPWFVPFNPLPGQQATIIGNLIKARALRLADRSRIIYFGAGPSENIMLSRIGTAISQPNIRVFDIEIPDELSKGLSTSLNADLVIGAPYPNKPETVRKAEGIRLLFAEKRSSVPLAIFTPPPVKTRAYLAARYVIRLLRSAQSPIPLEAFDQPFIFDAESRTLRLEWSIDALNMPEKFYVAYEEAMTSFEDARQQENLRACCCENEEAEKIRCITCKKNTCRTERNRTNHCTTECK